MSYVCSWGEDDGTGVLSVASTRRRSHWPWPAPGPQAGRRAETCAQETRHPPVSPEGPRVSSAFREKRGTHGPAAPLSPVVMSPATTSNRTEHGQRTAGGQSVAFPFQNVPVLFIYFLYLLSLKRFTVLVTTGFPKKVGVCTSSGGAFGDLGSPTPLSTLALLQGPPSVLTLTRGPR